MLTDTAIKALKPQSKLFKVSDRDGMYVVVPRSQGSDAGEGFPLKSVELQMRKSVCQSAGVV